jgi:pimeloyl-ACP methyl ester carboxylesterase
MLSDILSRIAGCGTTLLVGLMAIVALPLSAQNQGQDKGISGAEFVGVWVGTLAVRSQSLTLVLTVESDAGELKATIDSPDQRAKGIPVSALSLDGTKLRAEVSLISAVYTGELSSDKGKIEGTWTQSGMSFPLVLERKSAAPAVLRPQEPKPPFPYRTEEVEVENKKAGVTLSGSLVIPVTAGDKVSGEFPAVVFATGSGPQDRNEEILGHKSFLVIADYLARRGIASLRCDDRGFGKSTGDFAAATTLDFADDIEAEFEYLASRPGIKAGSVGIVGHSEGGIIAPIVASRNARVSFIVLLAGPGIPGEELLYLQGARIAKAQGASDADVARARSVNELLYGIAKGSGDAAEIAAKAKKAYLDWIEASATLTGAEKEEARSSADSVVAPLSQPWLRAFLSLDPRPYLAKVRVPVLALNGSKDLQVPPKENLAAIKAALGSDASAKSELVELPGLNHLFQHANTGAPDEYGKIEETFAPEALEAIGDFILGL